MNYALATRESASHLAKDMSERLPGLAEQIAMKHGATKSGRKEYTRAIWCYFDDLRKIRDWSLWPKKPPVSGRVKGEYLTDFSLCDEQLGYRIACESEWGNLKCLAWAFDKLRAVKADTKILIFQSPLTADSSLPSQVGQLLRSNLAKCGHHHPGHEVYLFIQFDKDKSRLFLWEPKNSGPLNNTNDIVIDLIS